MPYEDFRPHKEEPKAAPVRRQTHPSSHSFFSDALNDTNVVTIAENESPVDEIVTKADDPTPCPTCKGTGKIRAGNVTCPDCKGSKVQKDE